jgi:hypothetical protein
MKITFKYDLEKDVWCLLNKGKSSMNSQNPTKQYQQLRALHGEDPSSEAASSFIDTYFSEKNIDVKKYIDSYQNDWNSVAEEYTKRAEQIFGVSLPQDVIAYLTINSRCPYSLEENYFFVTVPTYPYIARKTVMHELWHFYTWYAFGIEQEEKLGKEKYNEIKEALTVLLNIEYADLLPEGITDTGYSQHAELRNKILSLWAQEKDIHKLWDVLVSDL